MDSIEFATRCILVCLKWRASVSSWGRTVKRNDLIHGEPNSLHLIWLGMDVVLDVMEKNLEFEKDCSKFKLMAIFEKDHYHLQPAGV